MISAGNDIVALSAVDLQRTELPAFYSKFITKAEFALHEHSALPFTTFVWLLWSVKESAYKYLKRLNNSLVFPPINIIVEQLTLSDQTLDDNLRCDLLIDTQFIGVVVHNQTSVYFRTLINKDFIATTIGGDKVYWGIQNIVDANYKTQSDAVRLFALDALGEIVTSDDLWIDKHADAGYPIVMHGQHPVDIPLSFAHHGSLVSYSFQIPK
ncbi:4'-phosphopantetheinyl transferase family protein [Mucilaginibacter antarcticus]|uniref:4'-phosphopantetheinyl transferase superfamily protein n=1 Tax=Mucilaginibacter antarcticus TaxID=1855725 RepID=A0ABW5XR92_9SPHI